MRVSELTGALLDYWVARAEGVPAEQLTIRRIQRSTECHVVRDWVRNDPIIGRDIVVLAPSTNWAQGGPLIQKYKISINDPSEERARENKWAAWFSDPAHDPENILIYSFWGYADTPLQAICRAVVRAAFGDEVEEVAVCQ